MRDSITNHNFMKIVKRVGNICLIALFYIVLWVLVSKKIDKELLFPSPYQVILNMIRLAKTSEFWLSILLSLLRISFGLLIGVIFATMLSILCHWQEWLSQLLSPLIHIIRTTPVASFIILALLWIPTKFLAIFIAALTVFPVVYNQLLLGLSSCDAHLIELVKFYSLSYPKRWRYLYLPSVFPQFINACITAQGLAWKSGIASEVLATPVYSIGRGIYESKIYLESANLFAWTAIIILLSLFFEFMIKKIFKHKDIIS